MKLKAKRKTHIPDPDESYFTADLIQNLKVKNKDKKGKEIIKDEYGRRYYRVLHAPRDQMFIFRLVKGIISAPIIIHDPVSDSFYSYESSGEIDLKASRSLWLDRSILGLIFSDHEHYHQQIPQGEEWNEVFAVNDFRNFWKNEEQRYRKTQSFLERLNQSDTTVVKNRIQDLSKRCEGKSGLHFMEALLDSMEKEGVALPSILHRADKLTASQHLVAFQKELMNRIHLFEYTIAEREKTFPSPPEA